MFIKTKQKDGLGDDFLFMVSKEGLKLPNGFTKDEILDRGKVALKENEMSVVTKYFDNAEKNTTRKASSGFPNLETMFFVATSEAGKSKFVISLDAKFRYIEYVELQEARRAADSARTLALWAIRIAVIGIILSFIFAYFITQNVKIDKEQFGIINELQRGLNGLIVNTEGEK